MIFNVKKIINSKFAIKEDKGNILYSQLKENLEKKENIELDFSEIVASTTRFFNVSLGKLYGEFPEKIVDNIKISNANKVVANQIEVSKNGSKDFYRNKKI